MRSRKWLALLLCALLFCQGCASESGESGEDKKEAAAAEEEKESGSRDEDKAETEDTDETAGHEESLDSRVDRYIAGMTPAEKTAQLFIVLPESVIDAETVTAAGEMTKKAIDVMPVGGFIYLGQNLETPDQVKGMLSGVQEYSMDRIGLPMFTCVDEEGGTIARIGGNDNFSVPRVGDMCEIGAGGDVQKAYEAGSQIGGYLSELGFNVDFAPVADVLSNPENQVVKRRSFGSDPQTVSDMAAAVAEGLRENGVCAAFKHFPGHGATEGDTHEGYAYTDKSLEELEDCDLLPFERGVSEDIDFIMAGHISLPKVIGDDTPASLSAEMLTEILRGQMGYDGIIITDAMNMGAIAEEYSSAEAAVLALQAGADMILMPEDYESAYQAVLDAMESGTLSADRIDESLRRIVKKKIQIMEPSTVPRTK